MSITIQKSTSGTYFTVQNPGDVAKPYIVNDYRFMPYNDNSFSLVSKYDPGRAIIYEQPYSNVINGDTGSAFPDFATLQTYIETYFFRKAGGSSGSPLATSSVGLPINAPFGYFGDSQTANGLQTNGNNYYWAQGGFTCWLQQLTNYKLYSPAGTNTLAVPGQATGSMLNRLGSALAYNLAGVTILAGTNDCSSNITSAAIIANLSSIISGFVANNTRVFISTILPRYGTSALTGPQETVRQAVNTWILTQSTPMVTVINSESAMTGAGLYNSDGLHPNSQGSYVLGSLFAAAINPYLPASGSITDKIGVDNNYMLNGNLLAGTAGTLSGGATGTVVNNFALQGASAGGATIVGSVTSSNGQNQQKIDISGTYTGNSKTVKLYQLNSTITNVSPGDVVEAYIDYEVLAPMTNVQGIYTNPTIYDSGGGILYSSFSAFPVTTDGYSFPLYVGRHQARTPPLLVTSANVAWIDNSLTIMMINAGSSTSVSASVKLWKIGVRKITPFNSVYNGSFSVSGIMQAGFFLRTPTVTPINATATLTAAQMASGYISSTSALATTITTSTATALITKLAAPTGSSFKFTIDNTAGANVVTLALGTGFTQLTGVSSSLTVPAGATGIGEWLVTVTSQTACTISRIQ